MKVPVPTIFCSLTEASASLPLVFVPVRLPPKDTAVEPNVHKSAVPVIYPQAKAPKNVVAAEVVMLACAKVALIASTPVH